MSAPIKSRLQGMKLTVKQQAAWDLKQAGRSNADAAAALGISPNVYSKMLVVCRKKLGLSGVQPMKGVEHKNPELAAAAIEAASDPWHKTTKAAIDSVNNTLKQAGLPGRVTESLVKRLRVKYAGEVYEARNLQTKEILEMLGKKIDLCAFYLDDKVMAEASARDIMMGLTALVEKRNLLRGEPTAIVSDLERQKLNELAPALLAEIKRRGLTIPGEVTEKTIN